MSLTKSFSALRICLKLVETLQNGSLLRAWADARPAAASTVRGYDNFGSVGVTREVTNRVFQVLGTGCGFGGAELAFFQAQRGYTEDAAFSAEVLIL